MKYFSLTLAFLWISMVIIAQDQNIVQIKSQIDEKESEIQLLRQKLEELQLNEYRLVLQEIGLPASGEEEVIFHSLMALVYDEEKEQAKWVAHVIAPEMIEGNVSRTNDFRVDPLILSGTAEEQDYFLTEEGEDGEIEYDGFGYDRGHLAPSADFRWSEKALSESYFYSNMSPQLPEFNRELWAELENEMRGYIVRHPESQLLVVTGPVFKNDFKRIERSVNGVAIPDAFFKVAYDPVLQKSIAFLIPHVEGLPGFEDYSLSVDSLESIIGMDFFSGLDDGLESSVESVSAPADWIPKIDNGDVKPLFAPGLPKNHFNTVQAKIYAGTGETVTICGKVVSTKKTRNGHVFLNLDKQFPNQIFTVTIWKDDLVNFSYDPSDALQGKQMCFTGKVEDFNGTPSMNINKEKAIQTLP